MSKTIIDCGNCAPDHAAIRRWIERNFVDVAIQQTDGSEETLEILRRRHVDLVLVNRKLDRDYSDGMDVIRQMKGDPSLAAVPVMLVTNYEEYQQQAIEIGAVRGFGKLALDDPRTLELVRPFLA